MSDEVIKDELKRKIESAWAASQYPGDSNIVVPSERPDLPELTVSDKYKMSQDLKGKNWQEAIPILFYSNWSADIFYLSPQGFRYYLAGYLTGLLGEENTQIKMMSERIEEKLHWYESQPAEFFLSYMEPLTREQKKVVSEVLDYLSSKIDGYPSEDQGTAWYREIYFWYDPDEWIRRSRQQS